jgi:hypothetical protein
MIEEKAPVAKEKATTPISIRKIHITRSIILKAVISP